MIAKAQPIRRSGRWAVALVLGGAMVGPVPVMAATDGNAQMQAYEPTEKRSCYVGHPTDSPRLISLHSPLLS